MRPVIVLLSISLLVYPTLVQAQAPTDSLAGKPPFRRLFLDATVVEASENLDRTFHAAKKHPANPVLKREHPWEGWGPYVYGTVLRDPASDRLRMWYQSIGADGADVLYAESFDGVHWTKPPLGLIEFEGSRKNNIVAGEHMHLPSVIEMPRNGDDRGDNRGDDRRFAMFSYGGPLGPHVVFSSDGLDWQASTPAQEKLFSSSDVINVFRDPYHDRFVAMYKTAARRHRSVGVAFSSDALQWTKPIDSAVFTADDLDPDPTQIYGMPVFPYQGLYIGQPWIYHARYFKFGDYSPDRMNEAQEDSPRTVDVQLAWSWDLINWTRTPERKPFIALGSEGEFDSKMIFTAQAPVRVGDELYFYYGGFDRAHDDYKGIEGAIGIARLRLDGFCSMQAGDETGWLVSRREVFNTPRVTINAATHDGGEITAELLDRDGRVIPGFAKQDCIPFRGDAVDGELRWKTGEFAMKLKDRDKKIRFILRNANLYAYLPADINAQIDDGTPAH